MGVRGLCCVVGTCRGDKGSLGGELATILECLRKDFIGVQAGRTS